MPLPIFIRFAVSESELLAGNQRLTLTLIGPTGNPNIPPIEILHGPEADLAPVLKGEQRFLQLSLTLPAMVIREGLYRVELRLDDKKVGSIPLPVKLVEQDIDIQIADIPSPTASRTKKPPPPPRKARRRR